MSESITKPRIVTKPDLKEPSLFKVIYVNDDVTTAEFVIESLMVVFDHSFDDAVSITEEVDKTGSAVAAILPYEMAEQKGVEVTQTARTAGFPLVIKLENLS